MILLKSSFSVVHPFNIHVWSGNWNLKEEEAVNVRVGGGEGGRGENAHVILRDVEAASLGWRM